MGRCGRSRRSAPASGQRSVLGVLGRPVAAELQADRGVDLVAPGRPGDREVGLVVAGQGQRADLAGAGDDRHHHRLAAADAGDAGCGRRPRSSGAIARRRVVLHREPARGHPVDQRGQRRRPRRRRRGRAAAASTWPPASETPHSTSRPRSTPGSRRGRGHRGAVVLDLAGHADALARRPPAGAEAAVVEGEHVEPGLGQAGGERLEPGVLGAAEPVRHHHDRPAAPVRRARRRRRRSASRRTSSPPEVKVTSS